MKHFSHLNTAVQLIADYKGAQPFSVFIKSFFAQHKKFGSKDRKTISNFCYCYFRLGHAVPALSIEERILIGLFLCNDAMLYQFRQDWSIDASLAEKIATLHAENISFSITDIFPWKELLSEGIDHEAFCRSFLIQPDVFLRLRPGFESMVKQKLTGFKEISANCISLPNTSKLDEVIELDKEAVVQDLNSQLTITEKLIKKVWDCCAASGGKSILAYDLNPNIQLTVSDVRESIIHNLKKRFAKAGIKNYQAFIADLSKQNISLSQKFNAIICDAPCSGSGTWSRTPEQNLFFKSAEQYVSLQRKIAANAIQYLQPGGKFIYITCSVFKQENEDNIAFLCEKFSLKIDRMELLKGYDKKADSLFVASLVNAHG